MRRRHTKAAERDEQTGPDGPAGSGDQPPTGDGYTIAASGLARQFPTQIALDGVDLDVEPGELVAVLGPSGSGKSTLLHLLGAMDTPTAGTLHVGGHDLTGLDATARAHFRRHVGFVFQRFHLIASLGVLENVLAPLVPQHPGRTETDRARALLAEVGLADRENDTPAQLSGGQRQRVAIARALVGQPQLMLADEPTGNLDSTTGEQLLDLLTTIHRDRGTTMLIATHDHQVAARCTRTVHLTDGRITDSP